MIGRPAEKKYFNRGWKEFSKSVKMNPMNGPAKKEFYKANWSKLNLIGHKHKAKAGGKIMNDHPVGKLFRLLSLAISIIILIILIPIRMKLIIIIKILFK